jgi:hypothetical protein
LFEEFHDPVREASANDPSPWSPDYAGPWLAAAEPILVPPRKDGDPVVDTGWVAIVEERTGDALEPVRQLRRELLGQALQTLALVVVVLAALWGVVLLLLSETSRSPLAHFLRRRVGMGTATGSVGTGGSASLPRSEASGARAAEKGHPATPAPSHGVTDATRPAPRR